MTSILDISMGAQRRTATAPGLTPLVGLRGSVVELE